MDRATNQIGWAKRTAILVLGMHRSGTSALTRVINLLGARLPDNLLAANPTNEAGHWEPQFLINIHDKMLAEAGSRWDDWRALDASLLPSGRWHHYEHEIARIITEDFGAAPLIVIKDPRICRFVPLYKQVFEALDISPCYVVAQRNPLSVINSLARRDGMTPGYAGLVWLRHILDAEAATRGDPRVFLSYESLLDDWRAVAHKLAKDLSLKWPQALEDAEEGVQNHLTRALQHHAPTLQDLDDNPQVTDWVKHAYRACLKLEAAGTNPGALQTLMGLKAEFDSLSSLFGAAAIPELFEREKKLINQSRLRLDNERARADRIAVEAERAKAAAENAERARAAAKNQARDMEQQLLKVREGLRASETALAEKSAEWATFRVEREALNKDLRQMRLKHQQVCDDLQALCLSSSWRLTKPLRGAKRVTRRIGSKSALAIRSIKEYRLRALRAKTNAAGSSETITEDVGPDRPVFAGLVESLGTSQAKRIWNAFDGGFYRRHNPDVAESGLDPFEHFMVYGWKEGRDPSEEFSVSYYLNRYPDIEQAGINPFLHYVLHGRREKRTPLSYMKRLELIVFKPKVSVIVPNFNHAPFLSQRLESILSQSYQKFDILILDDCSTDSSSSIIDFYCNKYPDRVRAIFNSENSGNVFRQWRKGVESTDGDLIWICESDDFCESNFLEEVIQPFRDRSVQLAFGRIQFADENGVAQEGLDQYREGAEAGIWDAPLVRPAHEWFNKAFGVNNVIANVGGCVWRQQALPEEVWREAEKFSVVGDWFLYCHLAGGGQIAYQPKAISYFRQHKSNTSVTSFERPSYYIEHSWIIRLLRETWGVSNDTVAKFVSKVEFQYTHFNVEERCGPLNQFLDNDTIVQAKHNKAHILIAFLGFHSGGGEVFAINLANALWEMGHLVSMLAFDMSDVNKEMSASLNPGIPVYDSAWVAEFGVDRFVLEAGISLIHSHMISLEIFLFEVCDMKVRIPYVVTLHGSYDGADLDAGRLRSICKSVDRWIYLSKKNLVPFQRAGCLGTNFEMKRNAVPLDVRPFPKSRPQLGIAEDAIVFTLVARGIKRKGWRAALNAFTRLRDENPTIRMHLLLAGEGEEMERHKEVFGEDHDISFLGYQSHIPGLYRMSDCAIVPTRFEGESFPLCVIEALQAGIPVVATDIGEIRNMIGQDEAQAGILIDNDRDTDAFIDKLKSAMNAMLDRELRVKFSKRALALGATYDMADLARDYERIYQQVLSAKRVR